jgi:hypothetical protein
MTYYPLCEHPFEFNVTQKNPSINVEFYSGSIIPIIVNFISLY